MGTRFNKSGFTYFENWRSIGIDFQNQSAREGVGDSTPAPVCTEESNWKKLSVKKKIETLIKEKVKTKVKVRGGEIKSIHFLGTDLYLTGKDIVKYNEIRKKVGDIFK